MDEDSWEKERQIYGEGNGKMRARTNEARVRAKGIVTPEKGDLVGGTV